MANLPPFESLDAWLEWQSQLHSQEIELGLDRVRQVANRLGVQKIAALTISVAGTNGKGSSAALLEQTLLSAGHRTGVYSSPHLLRYNERIRINGEDVSDQQLCDAFAQIEAARGDVRLTYFEYGSLAAFLILKAQAVDVAILEVGLGGRLDAVNIQHADVALITNIGLDHQDWLGDSREKIAVEKAGIMRSQKPVICNDPHPPDSIATEAQRQHAVLGNLGRDYNFSCGADDWCWQSAEHQYTNLPLPAHMSRSYIQNAAGVLAVLLTLQPKINWQRQDFELALQRWRVAGRCEWREGAGFDLLLDVSHNAEAAELLRGELDAHATSGETYAVFAALKDKPVRQMMQTMSTQIDHWYLADLSQIPRGMPSAELQAEAAELGLDAQCFTSVAQAWRQLCDDLNPQDRAVVFGSFHTVEAVARTLDNTARK